jgi:drug/metabolite transporter superfamily protein YnfA
MSKAQVVGELWEFMKENKKYWLAPIVITLVVFGVLLVLAKGSAIAPFIYTLF